MELKFVTATSRSAVVELTESGKFYTEKPYEIYVDGSKYMDSEKVITTLYGLKPDTLYKVSAVYDGQEIAAVDVQTKYEFVTLNVREFGAYGDGVHDDTNAIQCAIMACPKDSRVLVPEGVYKISSIFLKDNLTLELAKGAVLSAFTDREKFPVLPGEIESYDETAQYNLGSWEGNPLDMFSAIVCGINVENVVITGEGTIDGCTNFENWWKNCKVRDTAWRPRLFFINHCKNVMMHGITVQNSPSWTIHPYFSEHLKFIDVKIKNPANSHNTDGLDPESCTDVLVLGTYISVGDDCIAIKSGKIYMAEKYQVPTSNMIVRQCCMRDGHGAVTVGSEIAAGVKDVHITDCIFMNTDRGLRVKTRRGRGKYAIIDGLVFRDVVMDGVLAPFVINMFYFCDPDGRSDYVQTHEALPVDEMTPTLGTLEMENITATDAQYAGCWFSGLPEHPIEGVKMHNVKISFAPDAKAGQAAMMCGADASCKVGVHAENVHKIELHNVAITGYEGERLQLTNVDSFEED